MPKQQIEIDVPEGMRAEVRATDSKGCVVYFVPATPSPPDWPLPQVVDVERCRDLIAELRQRTISAPQLYRRLERLEELIFANQLQLPPWAKWVTAEKGVISGPIVCAWSDRPSWRGSYWWVDDDLDWQRIYPTVPPPKVDDWSQCIWPVESTSTDETGERTDG